MHWKIAKRPRRDYFLMQELIESMQCARSEQMGVDAMVEPVGLEPTPLMDAANTWADISAISRLLVLDDLWSAYLDPGVEKPEPDFDGLRHLAGMMDLGTYEMADVAARTEQALNRIGPEGIGNALRSMREALPDLGPDDWPFGPEDDDASMSERLIEACKFIQEEAGSERDNLELKIGLLNRDQLPGPDFSVPYRRMLKILGVAVATAAGSLVPGVGVFTGALAGTIVSDLLRGWGNPGRG
jgi:hypothetical protein